jgi:hypothetical protein
MFSTVAIVLALNFWTPYNGGQNPCPNGVQFKPYSVAIANSATAYLGDKRYTPVAYSDQGYGSCTISVSPKEARAPYYHQCAVIAHELGHSFFNLVHNEEPWSIMYSKELTVPYACYLNIR